MSAGNRIYHPVGQADMENLLAGQPFLVVRGQLIFRRDEEWVITGIHPGQHFTADEYRELPEGAPYQLINNELMLMPSPFERHQLVVGNLYMALTTHVRRHRLGAVRIAPMDVYLDENNVVQPDILFILEARREVIANPILGAPDLVVEVLSRATESLDRGPKRDLYARHGVQEYWIIDPEKQVVEVYTLQAEALILNHIYPSGTIRSSLLAGFEVEMDTLFEA
ncbi:MAG: Uma2 family endonuclease [Bacteroidia bacterium]|nr:Uma2 family endonuclease [Bacteroidia bacterium]